MLSYSHITTFVRYVGMLVSIKERARMLEADLLQVFKDHVLWK